MKRVARRVLAILGAYPDVGKGILTASIGYILQQRGIGVLPLKFDGYLNYNSGSMNPYHRSMDILYEEEEVFVLSDGFEADADSGYYERFLGLELPAEHNLTNGQILAKVLSGERDGRFRPGEVLKFVHIRDMATQWIFDQAGQADVVVLEIGGTVGDPESAVLYDALRSMKHRSDSRLTIILLAPYFNPTSGDGLAKSSRTKLARQTFERLEKSGLRPNLLAIRCTNTTTVSLDDIDYVASDCELEAEDFFFVPDCSPVYDLPMQLIEQNVHHKLITLAELPSGTTDAEGEGRLETYCSVWRGVEDEPRIRIGVFGKAVSQDSFVSLREAVVHAAVAEKRRADLVWIDDLVDDDSEVADLLGELDGLIVSEGLAHWKEKIDALSFSRINSLPTLCISFGFDLAAVELVRNVCGRADAFLEELETGDSPVRVRISQCVTGNRESVIADGSLLARMYGSDRIVERHRHRSWLSRELVDQLTEGGVLASGYGEDGNLHAFELPMHPFYVAMKAHPEFKSWPGRPSPPFVGLVRAAKTAH